MARAKAAVVAEVDADEGPWGSVPTGVVRFVCVLNGRKQSLVNDQGVEVFEHDVEDLSLDLLREEWGNGSYQLRWLADRDGKRIPQGTSRKFNLRALEVEEEGEGEEEAPGLYAVPQASTLPNPIAEALMLLTTLTSLKNAEVKQALDAQQANANTQVEMFRLMIGKEERREEKDGVVAAIAGAVQSMAKGFEALQAQMASLTAKVAEYERDDEEEVPAAGEGFTVQPGQSVGDVASAIAMNAVKDKLPDIMGGLSAMAVGFGQKMVADAEEKKRVASPSPPPPPPPRAPEWIEATEVASSPATASS